MGAAGRLGKGTDSRIETVGLQEEDTRIGVVGLPE
jgi:hypothetical protein